MTVADWFLSRTERGNPATALGRGPGTPAWSTGILVVPSSPRPLVHGEEYFARLHEVPEELKPGDRVFFTDWRGDADERLAPGGPELGDLLCEVARRGVELRGLLWRSHSDRLSFIDLGHGRRHDADHAGDPRQQPMDRRYGDRAPWHDAALELHGPVVGDVLVTFAERWNDRHPLDRRTPYRAPHAVQVLRTYGRRRPGYPFAPNGERSIPGAHLKAFSRARSLSYLEDQYLWSTAVARGIAEALVRNPGLRFIAVVPRFPDSDGAFNGPPNRIGQIQAMRLVRRKGRPAPDGPGAPARTRTAQPAAAVVGAASVRDGVRSGRAGTGDAGPAPVLSRSAGTQR